MTRLVALLVVGLLTACAGALTATDAPLTVEADPTTPIGDPPPSVAGDLDAVVAAAIKAAEEQTGTAASAIVVVTAERVTWSDGSLGCPQPGQAYTQALVPGYRVVLDVDGQPLHYHASEAGDLRRCGDPQPPIEGTVDR